jgi:DNA-binding beta-propeller fold protein YncE
LIQQKAALLQWWRQDFPVGNAPSGIAFDGENIWVANSGSNNVTKLQASDGSTLGTFPAGEFPIAIAFDGANMWVTNIRASTVTKLASNGKTQSPFPVSKL